jgi:cobalt-zinc-cadmium efflux system outer membrane protein
VPDEPRPIGSVNTVAFHDVLTDQPLPEPRPLRLALPAAGPYGAPHDDPTIEPEALPAPPTAIMPARLAVAETAAAGSISLAELETVALGNNPTLVQAAMQVRVARGKCIQAGLYPNPTIAYSGDEIGDEGRGGQQGAAFGQEIVTAGKLRFRSAVAAREIEQAEHAWLAQRGRVLNDVRSAWYEVLAAQRIVELNKQLVEIGRQGVKVAEDLLAAKEVARVDALQARIEADSARLQLRGAENHYQAAWRRLAAVLGTPQMEPAALAGSLEEQLPEWTWQDALTRLWRESPELGEAQAGVRRARCALAQECAERVPNIDLRGSVHYDNASRFIFAGAEFGMALPFYNRNQGNIYKAEAQLIDAEHEVQRVRLVLQQRLAAAFEQYATAREEVGRYVADILPNAQASLDLVRTGYRQGQFDYLTLLTAQRTFFRMNLAYLESLRQWRLGHVAIEGLLLSGGLQRGPGGEAERGSGGAVQRSSGSQLRRSSAGE